MVRGFAFQRGDRALNQFASLLVIKQAALFCHFHRQAKSRLGTDYYPSGSSDAQCKKTVNCTDDQWRLSLRTALSKCHGN